MLTDIVINGQTKSVQDYMILSLLNIPHTLFQANYWERLGPTCFALGVTCPMFHAIVTLGDENEVHQIDAVGIHHFSINKHRWDMWPPKL